MALSFSTPNVQPLPPDMPQGESLLETLRRQRWKRLPAEYDHPLSVLYQQADQPMQHWTLGWGVPSQENPLGALYVLIWQSDRFTNPIWTLYRDGATVGQWPDEDSPAAHQCRELLEGSTLPQGSLSEMLRPLTDYPLSPDLPELAASRLEEAFIRWPFIFEHFKPALLTRLTADLHTSASGGLEILKIHRLAHRTALTRLLKNALERGHTLTNAERQIFLDALEHLRLAYSQLGHDVHPLLLPRYGEAFEAFRGLLTEGLWHIRLRQAALVGSN